MTKKKSQQEENVKDEASTPESGVENAENNDISEENKRLTQEIEDLRAELDEKTKKCEESVNQIQRTFAEFDNFRKRTVKEKESLYSDAVSDTIIEMLPVFDNLERALTSCGENTDPAKLREGVEMVAKQFKDALVKLGVEEITALGETFNPDLHNAVMHIEDEEAGDNVVVEEFMKGFKIKDKVIRHSMVKVAN